MLTVNMHHAKTNLSKLIAGALNGKPFIIARAGKPLVKVEALEEGAPPPIPDRGFGMLKGKIKFDESLDLPEQLSPQEQAELEASFYDGPLFP